MNANYTTFYPVPSFLTAAPLKPVTVTMQKGYEEGGGSPYTVWKFTVHTEGEKRGYTHPMPWKRGTVPTVGDIRDGSTVYLSKWLDNGRYPFCDDLGTVNGVTTFRFRAV